MKKNEVNKLLIAIVAVVLIIIIVGGTTFAYWSWTTNTAQQTNISVTVEGATLTITDGSVTKSGMYPTKYCNGSAAAIGGIATVTAINATDSDMEVILNIKASFKSIATSTAKTLTQTERGKINWAIVEVVDGTESATCETTTYKGTLAGSSTASASSVDGIDTGISFISTKATSTVKTYRIYFWLDSTYEYTNQGSTISDPMQDLSIDVNWSETSKLNQNITTE